MIDYSTGVTAMDYSAVASEFGSHSYKSNVRNIQSITKEDKRKLELLAIASSLSRKVSRTLDTIKFIEKKANQRRF